LANLATPAAPAAAPRALVATFNRQRSQRVSLAFARRWTLAVLAALGRDAEVAIHLVGTREMTRLNQHYLQHEGSTDIITFDHGSGPGRLVGELFISIPDAVAQASAFTTSWERELARYLIHGLLHLAGEDDMEPAARRRMKRREGDLLRRVAAQLPPESLASSPHGSRRNPVRPRRARPAPPEAHA